MERDQLFWQTYLGLEKEFLEISKYIYITDEVTHYSKGKNITESCNTQLNTFSPYIADLIIRVCIEIEAISKELYFRFDGEKLRGDKNLYFDEDCLKLLDMKCNTHKKIVIVSCYLFNLTKEKNIYFKPLKEAHKRGGTDWEKAYQALKHDRYSSLSKGTIKNLLHAMGALYLLNVYYRDVKFTTKYLNYSNLDFSLGSSIFSVKRPSAEYVISVINDHDVNDILQSADSPFVLKYTDSYYKQVLESNKNMKEEMKNYWLSQPELNELEFQKQIEHAQERERQNPHDKLIIFWELAKYRLNKRIPSALSFEERKKLFVESPEWNSKIRLQNKHLEEAELTEANIQNEIDRAGILAGMELEQSFEHNKTQKAFVEGYCELVLDTGDIRYSK